jgi:NAD(P)-dependent dehydrogenase (short-subunit alcohol dehydrogenase family)
MTTPNNTIKRKIALVTGGSRGLGRDMALRLSEQGIDVILTYHTKKQEAQNVAAEIQKSGCKAAILQFDVSGISAFDEFLTRLTATLKENWGQEKFDYLVNNAGIGAAVPIAQLTEEIFDTFMDVHFKGVCFLTQKALTMMNDNGGVVFITAAATRYIVPGYAVYAACKSAIEVFARYVAKEYGQRGIRANIVAPGGIETDFNGAVIRDNPRLQAFIVSQTALGRVGRADDIGGVVAFLCSEDAKWVNGQRIEVAGGMNL